MNKAKLPGLPYTPENDIIIQRLKKALTTGQIKSRLLENLVIDFENKLNDLYQKEVLDDENN